MITPMLDRPPISDDAIRAAIEAAYAIEVRSIEFLALGHDIGAWTFRADSPDGVLFVKDRRSIDPARLRLVRYLADHDLPEAVSPIPTGAGDLSVAMDGLFLIAYPFLQGDVAAEVGLTDEQWRTYGSIVGRLHRTRLPDEVAAGLPRESFLPRSLEVIERVRASIERGDAGDELRAAAIDVWRAHEAAIAAVVDRTAALGRAIRADRAGRASAARQVICHQDIHTHNVFVERAGRLRVIDWDDCLIAPPERDLMQVIGTTIGLRPGNREVAEFLEGYGPVEIDPLTMAYYHADWAVQDIGGYATDVLLDETASDDSRAYSLRILAGNFDADGQVALALGLDPGPMIEP
jgi:spectinomycin phosphotransferase